MFFHKPALILKYSQKMWKFVYRNTFQKLLTKSVKSWLDDSCLCQIYSLFADRGNICYFQTRGKLTYLLWFIEFVKKNIRENILIFLVGISDSWDAFATFSLAKFPFRYTSWKLFSKKMTYLEICQKLLYAWMMFVIL